jgi:hypothetical protein
VVVILPVAEYVRRTYEILTEYPALPVFYWQGRCRKNFHFLRDGYPPCEQGKRVLLVSTDPASNVGQVFDQAIGNTIRPVTAVPGLSALEIDPQEAAHNTGPESLILSKVFCLMTLLTVSASSFQEPVPLRLRRLMSSPAY